MSIAGTSVRMAARQPLLRLGGEHSFEGEIGSMSNKTVHWIAAIPWFNQQPGSDVAYHLGEDTAECPNVSLGGRVGWLCGTSDFRIGG